MGQFVSYQSLTRHVSLTTAQPDQTLGLRLIDKSNALGGSDRAGPPRPGNREHRPPRRAAGCQHHQRSTNRDGRYAILRGIDKRYNYTLVNGIKIPSPDLYIHYVPLDIFPADLLQRLEVAKVLIPSMEGDVIGNVVNLVMKDAPAERTRWAAA